MAYRPGMVTGRWPRILIVPARARATERSARTDPKYGVNIPCVSGSLPRTYGSPKATVMTGFSAPGGVHTKTRLLALEGAELPLR